MKEKIIIAFKSILFILFILFYPFLVIKTELNELEGILEIIGVLLAGITLIVGMIAVFIWVLKKLRFIKKEF